MSEKKQKKVVEVDAVLAKAQADAKAEVERQRVVEEKAYGKRVEGMSHRQLRGELNKVNKTGSGLDAAYAIVSLAVLNNTQTKENPFAKLVAYLR